MHRGTPTGDPQQSVAKLDSLGTGNSEYEFGHSLVLQLKGLETDPHQISAPAESIRHTRALKR